MIQPRHCDIIAFQDEMEDAFKLDCNPEDLKEFPEAKKCAKGILKSRKKVNKMIKLKRQVLCYDRTSYFC